MNIGYACLAIGVPGSDIKSCTLKNATEERLMSLIWHNLNSLETMVEYNIENGIKLFRISSDIIPFGSSLSEELPWQHIYEEKLLAIGKKIIASNMRVSMHPGQYTVLNSPVDAVVERAMQDLNYHAKVLDSMGLGQEHKLILHLGGVYGNKNKAKDSFISNYNRLEYPVKNRLVLENDDKLFNIVDVIETAAKADIPVVYDNLHNFVNPSEKEGTDLDWIKICSETWKREDGLQKIHYSQQHNKKKLGAHSETIHIDTFLEFYNNISQLNVDIMLEVKDKNMSALKCINCVSDRKITVLEKEWGRYKYCVLEHSPETYLAIRRLLKNKYEYPALEMYRMIENSLSLPITTGNGINAAQHVWGYFKDKATETEKKRFELLLKKFASGSIEIQAIKNNLLTLAKRYNEDYLLKGNYFYR